MRIESVRIRNFRGIKDETIKFSGYTCLVGANGAGKSTVLQALNIFFRESANVATSTTLLDREDFHQCNVDDPIEVTVTFADLNAEAQQDLKHYVRNGKLIVTAVARFEASGNGAEVVQYAERLVLEQFKEFFEKKKAGALVDEQRSVYKRLQQAVPDLPDQKASLRMEEALRGYEEAHPELCSPVRSSEQFYGFTKGVNRLRPYIEWVYVPAVKDAATEQAEGRNSALGTLLQRTVRTRVNFDTDVARIRDEALEKYRQLLGTQQAHLQDLSSRLTARLEEWARPGVKVAVRWDQDSERSIQVAQPTARLDGGDEGFLGSISRLGHGLQRSYLIALLQELAGSDDTRRPTLILGVEEPELYQHPPQARHLSDVLQRLSEQNSQVLITTHSPFFVPADSLESVRLVRKVEGLDRAEVLSCSYADLTAEVRQAEEGIRAATVLLQMRRVLSPSVSEMFFAPRLVLVESEEDVAYIATYARLLGHWPELRQRGLHLLPVGRKSDIARPLAVANRLKIPTFVVFDGDANQTKPEHAKTHEVENGRLLTLLGKPAQAPLPSEHVWGARFVMWKTEIADAIRGDFAKSEWDAAGERARALLNLPAGANKNPMFIAARIKALFDGGHHSPTLERLCASIRSV
jgi:predicted ATP-dependent endonuclease of OLD family